MKLFQIVDGFCYWDATQSVQSLSNTIGRYPPDVLFVEAPDYVFEGWGYDYTKEGDERFIVPEAPEGWVYDIETGTFYPEGTVPVRERTTEERVAELEAQLAETDEAAIQLYEASLAQEAVNAEQDEAIIEIYETVEGLLNG